MYRRAKTLDDVTNVVCEMPDAIRVVSKDAFEGRHWRTIDSGVDAPVDVDGTATAV